ncbi:GIY-YIG nuclease family protein [Metamycoplasma faucium]|uniref:GIY-YIG nuclease family protein n=1 Tax=Metamycoplasma faucium TaxID=56142 RepID=A0ABZ2TL45_9BACT
MINREDIKNVKDLPGVYIWKGKNGEILYVGKAKKLHSRMMQYFNFNNSNSYKTGKLRDKIFSFETIICNSEREAFILERKLIDKYRPFYNVLFPTNLSFPYIKIKLLTNNLEIKISNHYKKQKNTIYFGPLPNNKNFNPLVKYLTHILLSNEGLFVVNNDYKYWKNKYDEAVNIINHPFKFLLNLREKIKKANDNLDFELAKLYADVIDVFSFNHDEQNVFIKSNKKIDVIGTAIYNNILFITVLFYRDGMWINQHNFAYEINSSVSDLLEEFINTYYRINEIPETVLISDDFKNINIENIFFSLPKTKLYINMLNFANQNAKNSIEDKFAKFSKNNSNIDIQEQLSNILKVNCNNIVIFDNSFQINTNIVCGAACVYQHGEINTKMSRHFFHQVNYSRNADVEYMFLTISKYLKLFNNYPNILIVDGSIQQVNEAKKATKLFNLDIPIFGLVKNENHQTNYLISSEGEEINVNNKDVFNFLVKMQFEVDRYAKKFYNHKEIESSLENDLLKIKGIGSKTLEILKKNFKTFENINNASLDELKKVVGLPLAKKILANRF